MMRFVMKCFYLFTAIIFVSALILIVVPAKNTATFVSMAALGMSIIAELVCVVILALRRKKSESILVEE